MIRQSDNIEYRARVFADNTLKNEVQKEIQKLALVLLGNHKLKIDHNKEGYDHIKPNKYKPYTYKGSWREWVVFGHSRTDIYLEVLKMLANDDSRYYPVVSFRKDDEWVEREEVERAEVKLSLWKITFFVWGDKAQAIVKAENADIAIEKLKEPYSNEDNFNVISTECLNDKEGILMKDYL